MSNLVFEEEEEKNGEKLGFGKISSFGWLCFQFLSPKRPSNIQKEIRRGLR